MRIAVVSPYALDVPGGAQGQALGLARAFAATGDAVLVVGPGERVTTARDGVERVQVGRPWSVPVNGSRAPVAPYPAAFTRTLGAVRRFGPDVVHVHEPFVPGPSLAVVLGRPAPIVATFHRAGEGSGYRALRVGFSPLARRLAACVAVSDAAAATVHSAVGDAVVLDEVLANAVDVSFFATGVARAKSAPTVLFVGRHEQRKGLAVALEAFGSLSPGAELWVVGEGPETDALKARHRDAAIHWLGAVVDEELASCFRGADVYVAPSLRGESFGVVLLEAMAAGTPVVASDLPGYRLAGGDAVEYVPAGDAPALAGAIDRLLADPLLRERVALRGHEVAASHSFEKLATQYRQIFERVRAEAAAPRR